MTETEGEDGQAVTGCLHSSQKGMGIDRGYGMVIVYAKCYNCVGMVIDCAN